MILCLGATPALQRVMLFRKLVSDAVNRAVTTIDGAGGKSVNVAKVLTALGERALVVGFLGGERGTSLRLLLAERGIDADCIEVAPSTRQCVTAIDEAAATVTELVEESQPVDRACYADLMDLLRRRVGGCRAAVMSGTLTPGGPEDFYYECVRVTRAAGALAVVDAQGPALMRSLAARPDLVKPNRAELSVSIGRQLTDEAATRRSMHELWERGARQVVVTCGAEPTLAFDGRTFWRVTPPPVPAKNPIGSGDAFTAGLVVQLLRGAELDAACRWGVAAGSANALTLMVAEVRLADVERLAREVMIDKL